MARRTTDPDGRVTPPGDDRTTPTLDPRVAEEARTAANQPVDTSLPDPFVELPEAADPYHITERGIQDPPTSFWERVRYLGPGLILSASIVGSGELIATTTLGAQVGFAILWMVLFSCAVKVAVQIEFARWTIATGTPALTGFSRVPPVFGQVSWVTVLWALMMLSKILQVGGIVGGTAIAFSVLFPIGGDPLGFLSLAVWHVIVVAGTIALLYSNKYGLIEAGAFYLVVGFSIVTVLIAFGLPFTPYAYGIGDVLSGLTFTIPAGAIGAAIAMFGITGVGADEIATYNYWCLEKGYARWTGPNNGSEAWVQRARGWTKVMYMDAVLSLVIYTLSTLAFFIMGAAVLHPQGLVPQGNAMITTLARMYTDTLGAWSMYVFLVGAIAVLASTLWVAVPSQARMYANFLATVGVFNWNDGPTRLRWLKAFTVGLPIIWGLSSLWLQAPVLMVQIGGVMTGIFLVAVLVATWYLRSKENDHRLYGGPIFNAILWISTIAIALLGIYTIVSTLGIFRIA
ncbi:MAG: Nramp family divalent metal transporter [Chloroflexota bacterium]|nr:Nramp family divalent metal transporter [Chloroflexota bacterium]